jgi:hypothetical protein
MANCGHNKLRGVEDLLSPEKDRIYSAADIRGRNVLLFTTTHSVRRVNTDMGMFNVLVGTRITDCPWLTKTRISQVLSLAVREEYVGFHGATIARQRLVNSPFSVLATK